MLYVTVSLTLWFDIFFLNLYVLELLLFERV
jgi:hypothetical protein